MYNNNSTAYSQKGDNIVHEAINLITADNGGNYIYIIPNGTIGEKNRVNIGCVLLVRKASFKNTVELVAKAEELTYIGKTDTSIEYNRLSIIEYFKYNTYKGEKDLNTINITFKAEKMFTLKKEIHIYITNDDSLNNTNSNSNTRFIFIGNKRLLNQSQRVYATNNDNDIKYKELVDLVNDEDIWESANLPKLSELKPETSNKGFIYAIGQQYNELAYSNLFATIFSECPEAFCDFCKKKDITLSADFSVIREYKNIDLLIQDDNNYIVIENKIHSGINGIDSNISTEQEERHSQLSKYYNIADSEVGDKKEKNYFIFAPEYETNTLKEIINNMRLKNGSDYTIVSYKEIYEFYKDLNINHPYFKEFLMALKHHIKSSDNDVEEQMIYRMLKIRESISD